MAGWLDYHEDTLDCVYCGVELEITIVEDGDPHRNPMVVMGLAGGQVQCSFCGTIMYDRDLLLDDESIIE